MLSTGLQDMMCCQPLIIHRHQVLVSIRSIGQHYIRSVIQALSHSPLGWNSRQLFSYLQKVPSTFHVRDERLDLSIPGCPMAWYAQDLMTTNQVISGTNLQQATFHLQFSFVATHAFYYNFPRRLSGTLTKIYTFFEVWKLTRRHNT